MLDIQEDSRALEPYPIESRLWGVALFVFTGLVYHNGLERYWATAVANSLLDTMCCGSCRGGFFIKECRSNQNNKVVLILWLKLREKIII
nr:MAG TPA: hypothetical protein [Caudoviricetes sp.]